MKIAAGLEYDGSAFCGWQAQTGQPTVQECVERALSYVADAPIRAIAAGRTDAGVHACAQVIHFETERARAERAWVMGANSNLPAAVALLWAKPVDERFHARFAALERRYRYVILNRRVRPTILARRVTWDYRPLDVARMRAAAADLVGTHDFSAFRALACQAKTPVRELRRLEVTRHGEFIRIDAHANAFLHHMVRNLAGVLMSIGAGEREPEWAKAVLAGRDRTIGGVTAPADGLYLTGVVYPAQYGIPVEFGSRVFG